MLGDEVDEDEVDDEELVALHLFVSQNHEQSQKPIHEVLDEHEVADERLLEPSLTLRTDQTEKMVKTETTYI